MSNLSTLQRNIIDGLGCEISAKAFLRACDRCDERTAEQFAYEVRGLVRVLVPMLDMASKETVPDGLLKFILDRHWFWRFPNK